MIVNMKINAFLETFWAILWYMVELRFFPIKFAPALQWTFQTYMFTYLLDVAGD